MTQSRRLTRLRYVTAVGALLFVFASLSFANVFLPDDRRPVLRPPHPWSYIGKLVGDHTERFCTAFVVMSPRIAWTAAHCLWDFKENRLSSSRFWYQPSGSDQKIEVKRYIIGTQGHEDKEPLANDWAILYLDEPATDGGFFKASVPSLETGTGVNMGAFSEEKSGGKLLQIQRACSVHPEFVRGYLMAHDCDSWHGGSGAPLFSGESEAVVWYLNVSQRGNMIIQTDYKNKATNYALPVSKALLERTELFIQELAKQ